MNSLPPKEYASLPKLNAPAGYICVLRDIDRDVYRIESTDHPASYVNTLLAELTGTYGIELLSILETDDTAASETLLYERHHAALNDTWLDLDAYQLRALRQSELRILDYSSHYIGRRQTLPSDTAKRSGSMARPAERGAAGQSHGKDRDAPPPVSQFYRYGGRRRRQVKAPEADSWRQSLSDKIDDFLHNHPVLIIAITLLLMLLFVSHFWGRHYPY